MTLPFLVLLACSGGSSSNGGAGVDAGPSDGTAPLPSDGAADASKPSDGGSDASDAGAKNAVYGDVGGVTVTAREAVYSSLKGFNNQNRFLRKISITLDDQVDLCPRVATGVDHPNASILWMVVSYINTSSGELTPNAGVELPVGTNTDPNNVTVIVDATLFKTDTNCANTIASVDAKAKSGSVTFDVVDESHVAGRFDFHFNGGRLSGFFDTPVCPSAIYQGTQVCQP